MEKTDVPVEAGTTVFGIGCSIVTWGASVCSDVTREAWCTLVGACVTRSRRAWITFPGSHVPVLARCARICARVAWITWTTSEGAGVGSCTGVTVFGIRSSDAARSADFSSDVTKVASLTGEWARVARYAGIARVGAGIILITRITFVSASILDVARLTGSTSFSAGVSDGTRGASLSSRVKLIARLTSVSTSGGVCSRTRTTNTDAYIVESTGIRALVGAWVAVIAGIECELDDVEEVDNVELIK